MKRVEISEEQFRAIEKAMARHLVGLPAKCGVRDELSTDEENVYSVTFEYKLDESGYSLIGKEISYSILKIDELFGGAAMGRQFPTKYWLYKS